MQHVGTGRAWLGGALSPCGPGLGLLDFSTRYYFIWVKTLVPILQETPNHCGSFSWGHLCCGGGYRGETRGGGTVSLLGAEWDAQGSSTL